MARKGGNPALADHQFQMPPGRKKRFDAVIGVAVTEDVKAELYEKLGKGVPEFCREAIFEKMRNEGMEVKI